MARLTAHEFPISKIFSSDFQYEIPDYQRPYSWGKPQSLELLSDLADAMQRDGDQEPYFLGSIVLVKAEDLPAAAVIDGQQRLTTLTILLSVLRELAGSEGIRSSLDKLIREPGDELQQLDERPRLDIRSRDRDFFRHFVQEGKIPDLAKVADGSLKTDAQRNIRDNTKALLEELRGWSDSDRARLSKLITNRTYLVTVSTPDLTSAHRIFNVMNARGLDLSAADIFKARVIGVLPDDQADAYAVKWEDAEEDLGRSSFQDLFAHIRVIYAKSRAQRELLQEFPAQVLDAFLPERAAEFVDQVLLPYATALSIVDNAVYSWSTGADEVNVWLRRLALIDNADWKPPALWLVRRYAEEPATLANHLEALERIAAVMLLRRTYATPRATRYANLVRSLESGAGLDSAEFQVSDEERRDAIVRLRGPIYEVSALRKFVLLRLDDALSSGGAYYQHPIITVEHVLPQNPDPSSQWMSDFTDAQREYWVHRLGNLVLLDRRKNSEAQNYDFAKKKDRYFKSDSGAPPFVLTTDVVGTQVWDPETVARRQMKLVTALAKEWGIARTSTGENLPELPEEELLSAPEPPAVDRRGGSRSVVVADLVASDLVPAGTILTWSRPRVGEVHHVTVMEDGRLLAEDGRQFDTPSTATSELGGGVSENGWDVWRTPEGKSIGDIGRAYLDDES